MDWRERVNRFAEMVRRRETEERIMERKAKEEAKWRQKECQKGIRAGN